MATTPDSALGAPELGAPLPESIPLPPGDDHPVRRETFLLLFCAAFAATVFFLWKWLDAAVLSGWSDAERVPVERARDLLGPFLTAYVAARLYSSMVRRYQRQLQRHRLLLAHILDTSVDGIVTLDKNDRISTWNRGATQIFGWTEEEVLGRHAAALFPPDHDAARELEALRAAVERAGVLRAHYAERVTKDGRRIRTEVSATVLRDAEGRYAGRASIVRDVTERDRIRDELTRRESLAAIGEMAAAVAHEIKNPLAGIGGAVQVIMRDFPEDDPRREIVLEVRNQVRRLDRTVADLLTFSRPTTPRPATIDLVEFLERILRVLGEEPVLKRHRVDVDVPAGLGVRADPQLLENIMLNLLLNAGQALGSREGTIRVRAAEDGAHTRLSVTDDGPGIAPDVMPRLFKPFFTTRTRGTGLGLAIVKKFVGLMGGRIDVQTQPGATTFTVVLPAPAPRRAASAAREEVS